MPYAGGDIIIATLAPGAMVESSRSTQMPSSGTITSTETILQTVTFTAAADATYEAIAVQSFQSATAGDVMRARIRYGPGATLTTSGTEWVSALPVAWLANKGAPTTLITPALTGLTGQYTVGVTLVLSSGTGGLVSFGASSQINILKVRRV